MLDGAALRAGDTLLDVGTGDGLIGLAALDRVGAAGHVIFSDVSEPLLSECRSAVAERGDLDRCDFRLASADDLAGIADASVNAVTTRAVLIYVRDKRRALAEFLRVLQPGGRLSVFEPINRLMYPEPAEELWGYPVGALADVAAKLKAAAECDAATGESTLMDFDDRSLLAMAEDAGFRNLRMELVREVSTVREPSSWESFLASAPNPLAPTNGDVIRGSLRSSERDRLEQHLRPLVEDGTRTSRLAQAHLCAERPL